MGEKAALSPRGKWYLCLFSEAKKAVRVDTDTEGFLGLLNTSLQPANLLASVRLRNSKYSDRGTDLHIRPSFRRGKDSLYLQVCAFLSSFFFFLYQHRLKIKKLCWVGMFASPHLKPKHFAFSYVVTVLPDAVSGMNYYGRTRIAQLNNIFII